MRQRVKGTNPFLTRFNVFVPLTRCLIFGVHSRLYPLFGDNFAGALEAVAAAIAHAGRAFGVIAAGNCQGALFGNTDQNECISSVRNASPIHRITEDRCLRHAAGCKNSSRNLPCSRAFRCGLCEDDPWTLTSLHLRFAE